MHLKVVYDLDTDGLALAFKGAGYVARDASQALIDVFDSPVDQVARSLKIAEYHYLDVSEAINGAYNLTADSLAETMKLVAYSSVKTFWMSKRDIQSKL